MKEQQSPAPANEVKQSAPLTNSQEQKDKSVSSVDNAAPKLSLKRRRFVEITARTLNPTEAVTQVYNVKGNRNTAKSMASELMTKPNVKKALERAMSSNKQDRDVLQEAYNAPRVEKITYGELHKYWKTALELKGKLSSDRSSTTNIGVFIDK